MLNWDYIAGFFDGEGCIGVYHRKRKDGLPAACLRLEITQAHPQQEVLYRIQSFLAAQGIFLNMYRTKPYRNHQECYKLVSSNREVILLLLKRLEPKLVVKRSKALEAINYIEQTPVSPRGRRKKPVKAATVARIKRMREEGMSQEEIARELGGNWHQVKVSRVLANLLITV